MKRQFIGHFTVLYGPCRVKKKGIQGFRPDPTQTGSYRHKIEFESYFFR